MIYTLRLIQELLRLKHLLLLEPFFLPVKFSQCQPWLLHIYRRQISQRTMTVPNASGRPHSIHSRAVKSSSPVLRSRRSLLSPGVGTRPSRVASARAFCQADTFAAYPSGLTVRRGLKSEYRDERRALLVRVLVMMVFLIWDEA